MRSLLFFKRSHGLVTPPWTSTCSPIGFCPRTEVDVAVTCVDVCKRQRKWCWAAGHLYHLSTAEHARHDTNISPY
eukprot:11792-Heterococcus_DN1.PRE.3